MDSKGKLKNLIIATQSWTLTASGSSALIAISYVFYLYKIGAVAEFNWLLGLIALFVAIILHIFLDYCFNFISSIKMELNYWLNKWCYKVCC